MPHNFNRRAFEAGRSSGNALLALYSSLVLIELSLKERRPAWPRGHRVQQWLAELNDAGITAFTYQLANELQNLVCTDLTGNEAAVALDSYPDVRYVRHDSDFPGKSTDTTIQQALSLVGTQK